MPRSALASGSARRLVLWRHGRTAWNADGRFQGQEDIELDHAGHDQARHAARRLASLEPTMVLSSDLRRAADTAAVLARLSGAQLRFDPRLRETHLGAWQGLTLAQARERFPDEVTAWSLGQPVRRGGGETEDEVSRRVLEAVHETLTEVPAGATLVAVSHGSALRVGIGGLLGLPVGHWKALGALANCRWSVLVEDTSGWRLAEHNAGSLPEPVLGDDL